MCKHKQESLKEKLGSYLVKFTGIAGFVGALVHGAIHIICIALGIPCP